MGFNKVTLMKGKATLPYWRYDKVASVFMWIKFPAGPILDNSLRHAGKFAPIKVSSLTSMKLKGSVKLPWKVRGRCRSCSWKKITLSWFMNSYMVKTEEYDNIDQVFGFKIF